MEKINVNTMIKPIEMNGGKVKRKRYSKWLNVERGCEKIKLEDKVTLYQINLYGEKTFIVTRDANHAVLGKGQGNGLQWIADKNYITADEFWGQNNPNIDEDEYEEE